MSCTYIVRHVRIAGSAVLVAAAALGLVPSSASAQPVPSVDWLRSPAPGPIARIENSMVWCGGKMVVFGGHDVNFNRLNDLWEYDTTTKAWTNRTPSPVPPAWPSRRAGHATACDPGGQPRVFVFGGWTDNGDFLNGTFLNDMWEWNTVTKIWTNRTPAGTKPAARRGAKMVYDVAGTRIVMFGGVSATTYFPNFYPGGTQEDKTWVWNLAANTWTALTTTAVSGTSRPFRGRTYHGMVYNSLTGKIWIYGGTGILPSDLANAVALNDAWELTGTTWTDRTPTAGELPQGGSWAGVAFDDVTDQMIVHSGWNATRGHDLDNVSDPPRRELAWAFNGTSWARLALTGDAAAVLGRDSQAMVFDPTRNSLFIFGGYLADMLELNPGPQTIATVLVTTWPPEQDQHSMAYDSDRDKIVMYGGGSFETWELSPSSMTWTLNQWLGPNDRIAHAMAYEAPRRKMILFGGQFKSRGALGAQVFNDTWEWDGTGTPKTWTQRFPATVPPARRDHAMAFDPLRNRIVMFGGRNAAGTPLNDTWEWDGSNWASVATPAGLTARFGHAMAYDAVRQTMVLFGGDNGATKFNETWERLSTAGSVWTLRSSTGPSVRAFPALSSSGDPAGGMLMFGGLTGTSTLLNDSWIWNGSTWTSPAVPGSTPPTPRQKAKMVYVPALRRAVVYGGQDANGPSADIFLANVTASVSPTPVLVTPSQGYGGSATFTALFRATTASSMTQMLMVINTSASFTGGVGLSFTPGSNTLQLYNDDGTPGPSGVLGSAGTLTNSFVSINLAGASRSTSSTDVALTIPMTFTGNFNGPKNIYLYVAAGASAPAGFQLKGTFFVSSGNSTPSGVALTPATGTGASPRFVAVYRDLNGVNDLGQIYFLINTSQSSISAVYLYYIPASNRLYLLDDSGAPIQPGAVPGSAVTLSNARFSVDVSQVTVVKSGTDLTLTLPIAFKTPFVGTKKVYLFSIDSTGAHTPLYQQLGTFTVSFGPPRRVAGDFDGDGKADLALFRPGNGNWMLRYSTANFLSGPTLQFGVATDKPVPGDYDGDGRIDMAVYRPANGTWYVIYSSTGALVQLPWGLSTDIPIPADFTGDGRTDLCVWRPSTGVWYIFDLTAGTFTSRQWGLSTDIPLTGDYDGDGKADVVAFRPSNGNWYVFYSSTQTFATLQWGISTDIPLPADYTGDGRADLVVYRPSTGVWYVYDLATASYVPYQWGVSTDIPVPKDYDGDGRTDLAVWRPSTGDWLIYYLGTSTVEQIVHGANGDVPIK